MVTYEGMFLTRAQEAAEGSWEDLKGYLTQTIENRGCQVKSMEKWDDRSLSYPIEKEKRAAYILVHFDAPGDSITPLRRDFALSERVMRVLITVDEDEGRPDPLSLLTSYTPSKDREGDKKPETKPSGEEKTEAKAEGKPAETEQPAEAETPAEEPKPAESTEASGESGEGETGSPS